MSVLIDREALPESYVKKISENLTLYPKEKTFGFGKRSYFNSNSSPPIQFYNVQSVEGKKYVAIPYYYAQSLLKKNPYYDKKYPSRSFEFKGTLRPYQERDIPEINSMMKDHFTTTLCLHPGYGKTIISAYLACQYKVRTIVILPNQTTLIKQWDNTFLKWTSASVHKVGEPKKRQGAKMEDADILICMYQRIKYIPKDLLFEIGMLIIDEAHMLCVPSAVNTLLSVHPKYIVSQTATLERADNMHLMMHHLCGEHNIIRKQEKPFRVLKLETNIAGNREKNDDGSVNWHVLSKSLAFNHKRNKIILAFVRKNPSYKIVILTGYVDHSYLLYDALSQLGESVDYLVGGKSNYRDSRVLIGTLGKISTGFDESSFCEDFGGVKINLGILTQSIKSTSKLEQTVGRVFRADYPNIMHIVDNDPTIKSHWRIAKKWYESEGGIIQTHNVKKKQLET